VNEYLPLSGIRICDFTAVWAGQTATMYLADMGAECIKVENPYIWNPMTRAASPRINSMVAQMLPPWIAGHPPEPGPRPWNNSPAFIQVLRNKKSFTVDSRTPEGLAVVQQLIRISDIVSENLALGTLDKLGLSDDAIRVLRPDAIILHMPAFGRTGAYTEGRGYGSHIDAVAGSTVLRGYRDTSPADNTSIFAGDYWGGMHGAFAVIAALRHRRRTGEGQVIEMAQVESSAHMFPQAALDAAWNGRAHGSVGNRSIEGFVPNGVFPTSGSNRWIAISCRTDDEWRALVEFMGRPAWAIKPDYDSAAGRAAAEDTIEELLAEFTAGRERDDLFHGLQAVGVTAGPVLNAKEAAEDPHLAASGTWKRLPATEDYPEVDWLRPAYSFSKSDVDLRQAPCLFGEHNEYVYRDVLGLSEDEFERMRATGHVADTFAPEALAGG
jgi:crotonobetainyl-CoA:carnitine CoA-transferase CaiB-like acyl-CoA transferase